MTPSRRIAAFGEVDQDHFRPAPEVEGPGGVLVGQIDYRPDALGLGRFCRAARPAIRGRLPGSPLRIAGRNPVAVVRGPETVPGIRVVGPVADVRPRLAAARVVVPSRCRWRGAC